MTQTDPEDDLVYVRRCVDAGDRSAFDVLVARHLDRIHGFLWHFTGDAELAADLAQETFLKAYRSLAAFQGGAPFRAWLLRIARNAAISDARARLARPTLHAIGESMEESLSDPHAPDPASALERVKRNEAVSHAIRALPQEFREILLLRDFEDRSYEDIAEIVGIPLGTVRSRIHRARGLLRDALRPLMPETQP